MDFNGVSVNELGSGRGPVATYAYGDGERTTSASTPKAASGRSRSWPDGKRRRQCDTPAKENTLTRAPLSLTCSFN